MIHQYLRTTVLVFFLSLGTTLFAQSYVSSESALKDLSQMVDWVKEVHYNPFLLSDSNSFNGLYDHTVKKISGQDSILIEDFTLLSMQLLATLNDGHTSINLVSPPLIPGLIAHDFFKEKVHFEDYPQLTLASGADSGKAISQINSLDIHTLYYESQGCFGGNGNFKKQITESIFFPIYLHLKGVHLPYQVQFTDGSSAVYKEGVGIKNLLNNNGGNLPDYSFTILEGNIGYIAYNSCNDEDSFAKFLATTFEEIKVKKVNQLIIDIQKNTGGNSGLNDLLLNYVTKTPYRQSSSRYWRVSDIFKEKITENQYKKMWGKSFVKQYVKAAPGSILKEDENGLITPKSPKNFFEGKMCMLIGPQTFSSANFLADAVATYKLMPLIGKPTGENTNDFGEQISLTLPNTKLILQVSIAYDIGADGDPNRIETIDPTMYSEGDALKFAINWFNQGKP